MGLSIMVSSYKFWWDDTIFHAYSNVVRNEVVMDQPIPFLKPNKLVRNEVVLDAWINSFHKGTNHAPYKSLNREWHKFN
uniref:Uncharacterized protein n=1 Tax=Arundo donax TaxID=35708 RepID=A0A0A9F8H5_ARUDO